VICWCAFYQNNVVDGIGIGAYLRGTSQAIPLF
jgi:hypothetical protein